MSAPRGLRSLLISDEPTDEQDDDPYYSSSDWVVVTRNEALLLHPEMAEVANPIEFGGSMPPWMEDFNNLACVLK